MGRNFTPDPSQRQEGRKNKREKELKKSDVEREDMMNRFDAKIHFFDLLHFSLKPTDRISTITLHFSKPLKVEDVVNRVSKALEDLLK